MRKYGSYSNLDNDKCIRRKGMIILGHRGIPVLCSENTLRSFLEAFRYGADGIETDVRLTKDGVPVLIHDDNLERLLGVDVKIGDLTFPELRSYRIGEETIPTLAELLQQFPGRKCLNLEIKEAGAGEISVEMSQKMYEGEIIYSSFNHEMINELKHKYPNLKFGYLFDETALNMTMDEFFSLFKENTFSAHIPIGLRRYDEKLFQMMLNELHKMGIKIALWTVDSKSDVEDIKEFVDYVITNDVRLFVE